MENFYIDFGASVTLNLRALNMSYLTPGKLHVSFEAVGNYAETKNRHNVLLYIACDEEPFILDEILLTQESAPNRGQSLIKGTAYINL